MGLLGNVTAVLEPLPISPVGRYVYPAAREMVRIIFISCTKFRLESSIITSVDGLLIDSIDCSEILRILRMKMQQLVCGRLGACMNLEGEIWR